MGREHGSRGSHWYIHTSSAYTSVVQNQSELEGNLSDRAVPFAKDADLKINMGDNLLKVLDDYINPKKYRVI